MACDASFLKHYHTPVIHFGILHFKNEETLFYSAGPILRYSQDDEYESRHCAPLDESLCPCHTDYRLVRR